MIKRILSILTLITIVLLVLTGCQNGAEAISISSSDEQSSGSLIEHDMDSLNLSASKMTKSFTDVAPDAWYAEAVAYCREHGIVSGTSETQFTPQGAMNRAMMATVLWNMDGNPSATGAVSFADVKPSTWYTDAIQWAVQQDIINGYNDTTFGVEDFVTREQFAVMLYRYEIYKNGEPTQPDASRFTDGASISDWAQAAVRWAATQQIVSGKPGNVFDPLNGVTRAEVAVMIYRYATGDGHTPVPDLPNENAQDVGIFNFETKTVLLNSGYEMPILGMGTYGLSDEECFNSVTALLDGGGRLIDTAYMYHNEASVGRAIRESSVPREEIFVITKIYPNQFANAEESINEALEKLDIGYIDMMLLHHPGTGDVEAYKIMEQFVADGSIRSIGLSNWYVEELETFLPQIAITPALVQNEIHPYYQENDVIPYIQDLGIVVQGWHPLGGRGHTAELLGDEVISSIAQAHGVSSAQVILRWNLQKGVVIIPGSSKPDHIRENLDIFGFELTDEDMESINALDRNRKA